MAGSAPEMTADVYYWLIKYEAECGRKVSDCSPPYILHKIHSLTTSSFQLDSSVLARMTNKTVNAAGLTVMRMKKKFESSGWSLDAGSGEAGGAAAAAAEEVKQAKPKRASPKKRKAEAIDDEEEAGRQKIKSEATDGGDSGTEC